MLKNYFKSALRNLLNNKAYSSINIVGLAIGLAACILISLWINDELSFDNFNKNADSIYRVIMETKSLNAPVSPAPLGPKLKEELPEVLSFVRIGKSPNFIFQYKQKSFPEDAGIIADSSIFSMFTFPFIAGNPKTALIDPASIVITESMAHKYFGNENPVDKYISLKGGRPLKVTGIIADIPHNSTLQFNFVLPISILKFVGYDMKSWGNFGFVTYLRLVPGINSKYIGKKINAVFNQNIPQPGNINFSLQHLKDIHFSAGLQYDTAVLGDIKNVYIFSIAAFFILFIASMNFINLTTARTAVRVKEIGVRKSIGAKRLQIIIQLFVESIVVIVISVLISIAIVETVLPIFNRISGKLLTINFIDYKILLGLTGIVILTAFMAETYPAIYLSGLNPLKGLKTNPISDGRGHILRKVLIVTQFSLSVGLIIVTSIIYQQISFMKNTTPGFNEEGVVYLPVRENIIKDHSTFKEKLLQYSNIVSAAYIDHLPVKNGSAIISTKNDVSHALDWEGREREEIKLEFNTIDYDYFKTMGMKIVEGRNFSKDIASDGGDAYILNEEAVNQMQLKNPVGKWISMNERKGKIIGVVRNAHFKSLQYKIQPQIFSLLTDNGFSGISYSGVIFIKIKGNDFANTLPDIKKQWEKINPGIPFEFHFLNRTIENLYKSEIKINTIFGYITLFAIFISCLGLFGLSSFMIEQKRKEIGIRKALGASISGIVVMLTKSYTLWILTANIIAWPVTYFLMNKWLQNYAYHININWWNFVMAGVIAVSVALLSVGFQSLKAATANPVESLHYE